MLIRSYMSYNNNQLLKIWVLLKDTICMKNVKQET